MKPKTITLALTYAQARTLRQICDTLGRDPAYSRRARTDVIDAIMKWPCEIVLRGDKRPRK